MIIQFVDQHILSKEDHWSQKKTQESDLTVKYGIVFPYFILI